MSEDKPPSRLLRERFAREYALPLARAVFELEPRCQSVLITVGQYWSDEARDAVHSEVIACTERDPTWPAAGQAREGAIGEPEVLADMLQSDDPGEPSSVEEAQWQLLQLARELAFGDVFFGVLSDNSGKIVAFASHCLEGGDQDQPSWRSHTPYGLIRRPHDGDEPTFEVIGAMHRPHWEDRWDVLEKDGLVRA
jgi:hypothetical protein